MVIVIEYDADPDTQVALTEAMNQINKGLDRLDPNHIKGVGVHVGIKDYVERVLAVFEP